ncbi:MAG: class SAM-dependent methyltransferase [Verrucomicrobiales bacterium]|nr:class SAM-dependent methyltransferase [Verrucomicrobiales bacterium]
MTPLEQHQKEIQKNLLVWQRKPVLQKAYANIYERVLKLIDPTQKQPVVEIGSGMGNLKSHLPEAICTDLFPNPWLDLVCDGYELPFADHSLSHLILSDVFHHLRAPRAFLLEAKRVLNKSGRLILSEPYIGAASYPIYGLFHHEPVARRASIDFAETIERPRAYYAAQGNATRLFFSDEFPNWLDGWNVFHRESYAAFAYFSSGGYSKPQLCPTPFYGVLEGIDAKLSRWPRSFGGRCLVGLSVG